MSEQPEALRLADVIGKGRYYERRAAAELRRLNAVNQELLEALRTAWDHIDMNALEISHCKDAAAIRAAIAKAEGQA